MLIKCVLLLCPLYLLSANAAKCIDVHKDCEFWASIGECNKNPTYMLENCKKSCEVCTDEICAIDETKCVADSWEEVDLKEGNEGEKIQVVFHNDLPYAIETLWIKTEERNVVFVNDLDYDVDIYWQGLKYDTLIPGDKRSWNSVVHTMWVLKKADTENIIRNYLVKGHFRQVVAHTSGNDPDQSTLDKQELADESLGITQPGKLMDVNTVIGEIFRFQTLEGRTTRKMKLRLSAGALKDGVRTYTMSGKHPTDPSWRQIYPRSPVRHPIRDPGPRGTITEIKSNFPYWIDDKECIDNDKCDGDQEHTIKLISSSERHARVWHIPDFLSPSEAKKVIAICKPRMFQSTVGGASQISGVDARTSKTCFLKNEESELAKHLASRAYEVLNITYKKGRRSCEDMQVVQYNLYGEYQAHHDYFEPVTVQQDIEVQTGSNRYATIMFVLSAPEKGGGTSFPLILNNNTGKPIVISPKIGQGIFWYHVTPDGNLDYNSLHQGDRVIEGEKWIATFFCWDHVA